MNSNKTELVFILDRSGSMSGLESDTVGGFNSMIEKQKKLPDEAIVTTVLFDNEYELLHDRIPLKDVCAVTEKEYFVRGTTALLDALGATIKKIAKVQKALGSNKAEKVLFVIVTDGLENASREYSAEKIKKMVKDAEKNDGWEFIFLGANIDAVSTAQKYGISPDKSVDYRADSEGVRMSYGAVASAVSELRKSNHISPEWKKDVKEDFEKRNS
ncbi:MAG: VWA domain-containing protein [Clostridia bacterium]|nr:VWA domain-containing protein [Clostridia bacterium]